MAAIAIPTHPPSLLPHPPSGGEKGPPLQQNLRQRSSAADEEAVYATLVRTYLDLLCHDNATFLAERCAAMFPSSENATYLLAYCHYRGGRPKSARIILLNRWPGGRSVSGGGAAGEDEDGGNDGPERARSSARYLLANCCYDLGLYAEAEESLLRRCRERFARAASEGGGSVDGVRVRGNRSEAMDAWIIRTAARGAPCPIPNGAAGLHLLGNVCRRTNRRQRAIEYYRLSLRLDPLMWTSYEAICELGGPEGRPDEADDPDSIFGVAAPTLSPRSGDVMMMMGGDHHGLVRATVAGRGNDSTAMAGNATIDLAESPPRVDRQQQQHSLHTFNLTTRFGTPSTPYSGFDNMKIGGSFAANNSSQSFADSHVVSNFNLLPSTAPAARSRGRTRGDSLPQTNLFAVTPAIREASVPAEETTATPALGVGGGVANDDDTSPPAASAIGYANAVLDRARRVVAGLAYEPSPESVRRRDIAASALRVARAVPGELTFSSTPAPSGADDPSPFRVGVSTVKGEKRALFSTHGDDDTITLTRKNSPKKDEPARRDQIEETHKGETDAHVAETTTGSRHDGDDVETVQLDEETTSQHVGKVLKLLCGLGAAYKYLCQYRSQDALELFRELPPEQINTGWVQHQIGKAYFEMSDYQNAQRALQIMQKVEPHRIKGLDILSTTLWQLKKEVELSDLAQRAVDFDRMAPEAWFVVGTCFSLQKEHETAITFFRRAIQLNPSYTYAHTLCGHEYTSNEDFDKATSCYRDAIRVDSRHYNAWYGLGAIYFRQEKYDLAEYHFRRALDVNPQSSVLHCHLGMAQHQNGRTAEALETLAGAFRLDPRNPQAHYQRATIFMALDRPSDALAELERVRAAAPKEASVHFNMGKVHKRLGQPAKAMRCFLTALDLDPKDNNLIKAAMDRLDEPDVEEEVSVF